jgi:hypothetical protein
MNKSLTMRGGLIGLVAGSVLLLEPFTAGARAGSDRDQLAARHAAAVADEAIVDGHLSGTRLHGQGRLVDSTVSSFRGSIRLTP